jgi:hypothetical protein
MGSSNTLGEIANSQTPEFRDALERLMGNPAIKLTGPQRRLLTYLGHKSLEGQAEPLKEYVVGVEAFGKPSDYNPQEDSSVRVQAGRLRQRLDEYFEHEGRDEPVVVRLEKGCFRIAFERREAPAPLSEPPKPARADRSALYRYLAAGLLISQLTTGYFLWRHLRGPQTELAVASHQLAMPAMSDFWHGFLDPQRPTVIGVGTPLFARFDWNFIRDGRFRNWDDLVKDEKFQKIVSAIGGHPPKPFSGITWTGDLSGVFYVSRYLFSQGKDPSLRLSGTLTWDDFRTHNVILLGSYKTFPYWDQIDPQLNFAFRENVVTNRKPINGEPVSWTGVWSGQFSYTLKDYSIVTRLTQFDGIEHLLLIEAASGEAGLAACQYLTDPKRVQELEQKLDPEHKGTPPSFQVVLVSTFRAQVPLETVYVTHRVIPIR